MAPPVGLLRGQNGSVRCNGRAVQCQALQTATDSGSSCSSKGDSSGESKGRNHEQLIRKTADIETRPPSISMNKTSTDIGLKAPTPHTEMQIVSTQEF